jgi:hypothetical protein
LQRKVFEQLNAVLYGLWRRIVMPVNLEPVCTGSCDTEKLAFLYLGSEAFAEVVVFCFQRL